MKILVVWRIFHEDIWNLVVHPNLVVHEDNFGCVLAIFLQSHFLFSSMIFMISLILGLKDSAPLSWLWADLDPDWYPTLFTANKIALVFGGFFEGAGVPCFRYSPTYKKTWLGKSPVEVKQLGNSSFLAGLSSKKNGLITLGYLWYEIWGKKECTYTVHYIEGSDGHRIDGKVPNCLMVPQAQPGPKVSMAPYPGNACHGAPIRITSSHWLRHVDWDPLFVLHNSIMEHRPFINDVWWFTIFSSLPEMLNTITIDFCWGIWKVLV